MVFALHKVHHLTKTQEYGPWRCENKNYMLNIEKFEIDMLNVKAADAFIIHAITKDGSEYVVLVDAGNEEDGDTILRHINTYYKQKYIDLAICSHCDSDHYGGFKRLIEEHNKNGEFHINKVWIHDPYKHVDIDDVKYIKNNKTLRTRLNEAYAFSNGSNLLDSLKVSGISYEEPFKGIKYAPLDIEVLGPEKKYYETLIPDFRVDLDFKENQVDDDYQTSSKKNIMSEETFYSKALEEACDDPSMVNQSSVVFVLKTDVGNLLFTGDAGKSALQRVVEADKNEDLRNLRFLKVPHHGSKHNLNNKLISYFEPATSFISTEKYGKYANICTVNALKKALSKVYSTHIHGSLCHHHNMCIRLGYSLATPL